MRLVIKEVSKFAIVGVINTFVDFGVFNLLLILTSVRGGIFYPLLRVVAFLVASLSSYIGNKFWVFKGGNTSYVKEYFQFASWASLSWILDISISSFVVNVIRPPFSFITPLMWANFSALCGIVPAVVMRFLGYKHLIFKKMVNKY